MDGLASLANYYSTGNALGRYREATRFFELAFAMPVTQMEKKLAQFLSSGPFGYTRKEVASWLLHRHGAIHGDSKKATALTWELDVRLYIYRIEQALLDILFNKTNWHDRSRARRAIWAPVFGTPSNTTDIFATAGAGGTLEFQMLDGWGAFPLAMSSIESPPQAWWCKIIESPRGSRIT
jgi:hypothetical protein